MGKWLVDGLLLVDRQAAGQLDIEGGWMLAGWLDIDMAVGCWHGGWMMQWRWHVG